MIMKKILAAVLAAACLAGCVSCSDNSEESSVPGSPASSAPLGIDGVGDVVSPEEGSDEYELGDYRMDSAGIKLYYDENEVSTEIMLALEKYFLTLQNRDFEGYKSCIYPDYAERYNDYLMNVYAKTLEDKDHYDLENSFNTSCNNLCTNMVYSLSSDFEVSDGQTLTGDFKITRIKGEPPTLDEGETLDDRTKKFFGYLDEVFDMDYYSKVTSEVDELVYITFFIIATGEDGEEHKLLSDIDIVLAKKDGVYYTFG